MTQFSFRPAVRQNVSRACAYCGTVFELVKPSAKKRFCNKRCAWVGTKGPEYNAAIARASSKARADAQRGSGTKGYVKRDGVHEHRLVAAQMLGRPLLKGEVVHHIDGDKHNNKPENLMVTTQRQHMIEHGLGLPGVTPAHRPWEARWGK